jgi:hypothetical protein
MNAFELSGISAGLGALGMVKKLRRVDEGKEIAALKNTKKEQKGETPKPKSEVVKSC